MSTNRPYVTYIARKKTQRSSSVSMSTKGMHASSFQHKRSKSPSSLTKSAELKSIFHTMQFSLNKLTLSESMQKETKSQIILLKKLAAREGSEFWNQFSLFKQQYLEYSQQTQPDFEASLQLQKQLLSQMNHIAPNDVVDSELFIKIKKDIERLSQQIQQAFEKEDDKEINESMQPIIKEYLQLTRGVQPALQTKQHGANQNESHYGLWIKTLHSLVQSLRNVRNTCEIRFHLPEIIYTAEKSLVKVIPQTQDNIQLLLSNLESDPDKTLDDLQTILLGNPPDVEFIHNRLSSYKSDLAGQHRSPEQLDLKPIRLQNTERQISVFDARFKWASLHTEIADYIPPAIEDPKRNAAYQENALIFTDKMQTMAALESIQSQILQLECIKAQVQEDDRVPPSDFNPPRSPKYTTDNAMAYYSSRLAQIHSELDAAQESRTAIVNRANSAINALRAKATPQTARSEAGNEASIHATEAAKLEEMNAQQQETIKRLTVQLEEAKAANDALQLAITETKPDDVFAQFAKIEARAKLNPTHGQSMQSRIQALLKATTK